MTQLHRFVSIAIFVIAVYAVVTGVSAENAFKSVVSTDLVRAELMAYVPQGVGPDKTVWVGLQLKHQPGWHTYWKNSGDSGQPTSLTWTLPPGVTAGDIAWPLPKKIPIGNLANYGYDGTVLLPVPLTISPDFNPPLSNPALDIKLQATWLVCRQECVPQEGEFVLQVAVNGSTAINAADFDAAFQATPKIFDGQSSMTLQNNALHLSVTGLPDAWNGNTIDTFPETPEVIETAAQSTQAWQDNTWTATIPLSAQRLASPEAMPWVLAAEVDGHRHGFVTTARLTGDWPTQQASTVASPTSTPVLTAPSIGFWEALVGALLGGMLLNLMPCVFPVLAIKVLSFTRHANDYSGHRISGLAYSFGVLLSFMALGGVMLVLRSGGEQLGWGFQLQSPVVVAALAALFTVMGMNLAGLFEFGLFVPGKVAVLEAKNPAIDAFMSGILAVLIASPCTAPFMGASLGLALGLPASQSLLVFATMGLGMSLPYLAASLSPSLAQRLPRSGAWMVTFRQAMAFPMFATVVWLIWVLGQQSGIHGAMALLTLLLGLSMVIWALTLPGRSGKVITLLSIAAFAALTGVTGQYVIKDSGTSRYDSNRWQPWAPGKVEQWLSGGRPVFVDFTAAWCVTCQYNEHTTLSHAGVLADFDAKNVVLLRADWTRRDPAITAALSQLGRNGVPVYVLYQPGQTPVVLSEILTVDEVRSLLRRL